MSDCYFAPSLMISRFRKYRRRQAIRQRACARVKCAGQQGRFLLLVLLSCGLFLSHGLAGTHSRLRACDSEYYSKLRNKLIFPPVGSTRVSLHQPNNGAQLKSPTHFRGLHIVPPVALLAADEELLREATHLNSSGNLLRSVLTGRTVINPCVATLNGVSYFSAREHMKLGPRKNNWWSNIVIGQLPKTQTLQQNMKCNSSYLKRNIQLPSGIARCLYKQPGHYITGPADPRLFEHAGELWVTYSFYSTLSPERSRSSTSSCMDMVRYSAAVWIQNVDTDEDPVELFLSAPRMAVEKNWIFFSQHGSLLRAEKLLAVLSVEPHIVHEVSIKSGRCKEIARTSSPGLFAHIPTDAAMHLGAIPATIRYKLIFQKLRPHLHFLRSHPSVQIGMFHSKQSNPAHVYKHYFYVFNQSPPFDVLCVSRTPVAPARKHHISFETSIEIEENGEDANINVWFGIDDAGGGMASFTLSEVLNDLTCTNPSVLTTTSAEPETYVPRLQNVRFSPLLRESRGVFNPSILALPLGSKYPFVVVARSKQVKAVFRGSFSNKEWPVYRSELISCVLDASFICVGNPVALELPIPYRAIEKRLIARSDDDKSYCYDAFIGAEDGRLVWVPSSRQVLLSYGMNSESDTRSSRNIWVVDLAEVYPFLKTVLSYGRHEKHTRRSLFNVPTELLYTNATRVEKNWILFSHLANVHVSYSLFPRSILDAHQHGLMTETALSSVADAFSELDLGQYRVNQGTGMMRVKLCMLENCRWDAKERYVSIFHTRHRYTKDTFQHNMAVFEGSWPFRIETIFPLNNLDRFWTDASGSEKYVYPISLDFVRPVRSDMLKLPSHMLNIATLDSVAVIGVGADDETSHVYTSSVLSLLDYYLQSVGRSFDLC
jgi:hypothetical protein